MEAKAERPRSVTQHFYLTPSPQVHITFFLHNEKYMKIMWVAQA
jgi:hypothetical protein